MSIFIVIIIIVIIVWNLWLLRSSPVLAQAQKYRSSNVDNTCIDKSSEMCINKYACMYNTCPDAESADALKSKNKNGVICAPGWVYTCASDNDSVTCSCMKIPPDSNGNCLPGYLPKSVLTGEWCQFFNPYSNISGKSNVCSPALKNVTYCERNPIPTKFGGVDTCPDGYTLVETKNPSAYQRFPLDPKTYPKILVCSKDDGSEDAWSCPVGYNAKRTGPCCRARTEMCRECDRSSTWFCIPQEGPKPGLKPKSTHIRPR